MNRISASEVATHGRFYRLPKALFEVDYYKPMKLEAKVFYSFLSDRFELSLQNNWIDDEGNIYFIFTIDELVELSGYGRSKVMALKKELREYGLLEEVRQGLNKPNKLYLGMIDPTKSLEKEAQNPCPERKSEIQTSGGLKNRLQEVRNSDSNDTDISDTENKEICSSRKTTSDSDESSSSPGAEMKSTSYVRYEFYSILNLIEQEYFNHQPWHSAYHLTHRQKMKLGEFLETGYISSEEMIGLIKMIPATDSPYAYLVKSIENLIEEHRLEQKLQAHRMAKVHYGT